jgi:hypothetical protein
VSAKINVLRKKAFCGCATVCKVEIDGTVLGEVKNGESISVEVDEGVHSYRFLDSYNKLLNEGTLTVFGDKDIAVEVQFNGATGKLDVHSIATVCDTKAEPKGINGKLAVIFVAILIASIIIYCGALKLFS